MELHKTQPDLVVYSPDKREILSNIWSPYNMAFDYNFGAASELSFSVQKYIYNIQDEKWVENPCYNYLEKDMILNSTDNDDYFRFNGYKPEVNFSCKTTNLSKRTDSQTRYWQNSNINNAQFNDEIELYDVGVDSGYIWECGCYISSGGFIDSSDNMASNYNRIACKDFFPVKEGDVIAILSKTSKTSDGNFGDRNGIVDFSYYIDVYSDSDAKTWKKQVVSNHTANPISRIRVDSSWFGNGKDNGYIRFSAGSHQSTYDSNSNSWNTIYPARGYVIIYSGERHCRQIDGKFVGEQKIKIPWWVVVSTEEVSSNNNSTKKVTAYSYEYILSKRTFTLSGNTLPLYIPSNLYNLVNSSNWLYDVYSDSNNNLKTSRGKQRISKGLINQILECLSNWSIGYISEGLSTKYRTFDNVDNANIYSFLINEIQSKFNCFVIFDTVKMTINLISKNDCILKSNTILTWDNAVKSMKITNADNRFVTAMRVHTSDDTYGLGLINPTGNNIIYNFSAYEEYMDFVADKDKKRTLYDAVNSTLINPNGSSISEYRKHAKVIIEQNMEIVKIKTKLSEILTNYKSKADVINTYLSDDYSRIPDDFYISDQPRNLWDMKYGKYRPIDTFSNYHSQKLYKDLLDLVYAYENTMVSLNAATDEYNKSYSAMQSMVEKTSINILSTNSELSKKERKALIPFIVEGDWSNRNAVYSDTYSADDIYNTLVEVYNDAKSELNNVYSKKNYDFTVDIANILAIDNMKDCIGDLALGNCLTISNQNQTGWINPILLSMHIDYNDLSNFTMTFSTDYNRKPLELRFNDLFGTITQVSVETPTFTFGD